MIREAEMQSYMYLDQFSCESLQIDMFDNMTVYR